MSHETQEQLMAKYNELAETYSAPVERPKTKSLIDLRRWYRGEVQSAMDLAEILVVIEKMIELSDDLDVKEPIGRQAMSKLSIQHELHKVRLNAIARELGLTPAEWS